MSVLLGGASRIPVRRRLAVREEHRTSHRDSVLALRVAEKSRPAECALDHQLVGNAARGVVPAVGRAGLPLLAAALPALPALAQKF